MRVLRKQQTARHLDIRIDRIEQLKRKLVGRLIGKPHALLDLGKVVDVRGVALTLIQKAVGAIGRVAILEFGQFLQPRHIGGQLIDRVHVGLSLQPLRQTGQIGGQRVQPRADGALPGLDVPQTVVVALHGGQAGLLVLLDGHDAGRVQPHPGQHHVAGGDRRAYRRGRLGAGHGGDVHRPMHGHRHRLHLRGPGGGIDQELARLDVFLHLAAGSDDGHDLLGGQRQLAEEIDFQRRLHRVHAPLDIEAAGFDRDLGRRRLGNRETGIARLGRDAVLRQVVDGLPGVVLKGVVIGEHALLVLVEFPCLVHVSVSSAGIVRR